MTNADKYLKDGVNVEEFVNYFKSWYFNQVNWMGGSLEPVTAVVEKFLKAEIKPTLTEDEKVILSYINTDIYAKIGRYKNGEIIFRNINDSYIVLTPYFKFENMFQFIQPRRRI